MRAKIRSCRSLARSCSWDCRKTRFHSRSATCLATVRREGRPTLGESTRVRSGRGCPCCGQRRRKEGPFPRLDSSLVPRTCSVFCCCIFLGGGLSSEDLAPSPSTYPTPIILYPSFPPSLPPCLPLAFPLLLSLLSCAVRPDLRGRAARRAADRSGDDDLRVVPTHAGQELPRGHIPSRGPCLPPRRQVLQHEKPSSMLTLTLTRWHSPSPPVPILISRDQPWCTPQWAADGRGRGRFWGVYFPPAIFVLPAYHQRLTSPRIPSLLGVSLLLFSFVP